MKEIENIIRTYDQVDWTNEQVALGTVVKVEESSYRRVGARMFVSSNGNWIGGISGGCLEGDALKRAQIAINKNQSSIVVYDTMDDDSHQIGVGLGCNGRIEVMFTPIHKDDLNNPIEYLKTIAKTRETEVLLQVLSHSSEDADLLGSFYPLNEIDMLTTITGLSNSDIDDGISEALTKRKSKVFSFKNSIGISFEILVELLRPKVKLICIGDNYDVNAFVSIVHELGWEVHVAGKLRKLNKQIFDLSESVSTYEEANKITIDKQTAVVLMSHDYKTDLTLLQHYLNTEVLYIGLLGPKKRMIKIQKELSDSGSTIDLEALPNLFAPVGLDIGAESPEEIALSIAAEIVSTLRERDGGALRNRLGPIHERDA